MHVIPPTTNIMKSQLLLLLSFVLIVSCTNQGHKPMTEEEKSSAKVEIQKFMEILAKDFNSMNFDKTMSRSKSVNSSKIWFVNTKGIVLSYEEELEAIKSQPSVIKEFRDFDYKINQIIVLSPEIAYATITYSVKLIFHNDRIDNHPQTAATSIFKKIDNEWICIHWHESSSTPEEDVSK